MPTLTLLHNPHCPTSVHALEALEAAGHEVTIRKYLLVAERLDEAELRSLAERLQGDPVDALIRRDKQYKDLGLQADGWDIDQVVATLLEHPSLLQRPILDDGTATDDRPPALAPRGLGRGREGGLGGRPRGSGLDLRLLARAIVRPPRQSAKVTPSSAHPSSTTIGPSTRAPSKKSTLRTRSTPAPGGRRPPTVPQKPGSSGRAKAPPAAGLPRMTNSRITSAVPAIPASACSPLDATAVANTISAPAAHSARNGPSSTSKPTRTTSSVSRLPTTANAASAPTRSPARLRDELRLPATIPSSTAAK